MSTHEAKKFVGEPDTIKGLARQVAATLDMNNIENLDTRHVSVIDRLFGSLERLAHKGVMLSASLEEIESKKKDALNGINTFLVKQNFMEERTIEWAQKLNPNESQECIVRDLKQCISETYQFLTSCTVEGEGVNPTMPASTPALDAKGADINSLLTALDHIERYESKFLNPPLTHQKGDHTYAGVGSR